MNKNMQSSTAAWFVPSIIQNNTIQYYLCTYLACIPSEPQLAVLTMPPPTTQQFLNPQSNAVVATVYWAAGQLEYLYVLWAICCLISMTSGWLLASGVLFFMITTFYASVAMSPGSGSNSIVNTWGCSKWNWEYTFFLLSTALECLLWLFSWYIKRNILLDFKVCGFISLFSPPSALNHFIFRHRITWICWNYFFFPTLNHLLGAQQQQWCRR